MYPVLHCVSGFHVDSKVRLLTEVPTVVLHKILDGQHLARANVGPSNVLYTSQETKSVDVRSLRQNPDLADNSVIVTSSRALQSAPGGQSKQMELEE